MAKFCYEFSLCVVYLTSNLRKIEESSLIEELNLQEIIREKQFFNFITKYG